MADIYFYVVCIVDCGEAVSEDVGLKKLCAVLNTLCTLSRKKISNHRAIEFRLYYARYRLFQFFENGWSVFVRICERVRHLDSLGKYVLLNHPCAFESDQNLFQDLLSVLE